MKGAALMVGAHDVAEIAQQIEHAARQAQMAAVPRLVDELQQALARVEEYLRKLSDLPP